VAAERTSEVPERFWTAKEWSQRTRVPYRTILAAAARGELVAVRPSRGHRGVILISRSSWEAWLEASRLRVRLREPVDAGGRSLAELAIGGR
jgi:hypothetical protein